MATDTKNESTSKSVTPSATIGNGGGTDVHKLHLRRFNKKRWLIGLAVVVVILLGWWIFNMYIDKAVFKINGKRYDEGQVKSLAAYQTDVQHISYKTAAKNVYNALRYQVAAESVHITTTPVEEKSVAPNVSTSTYNKYKSWFSILDYNNAIAAKLPKATTDAKQGYAYVFWFGDAVQPTYGTGVPNSKYGNQQAYRADQQYANQRANYYHSQLQNKKMTPSQVLTAVKKDPKLAPYGQTVSNPSTQFGTATYQTWQNQLANSTIANYAGSISNDNTLSPIETDTTATQLGVNPGKYVEAYYYIVFLQKAHFSNITQQFRNAQSHLHARYYGV